MAVVFRPLPVAAAYLRKRSVDLAEKLRSGGVINEIQSLFLIRAVSAGPNTVVTVLEIPALLGAAFGGQDLSTDYFSPGVVSNYGPLTNAMLKPTVHAVEGQPAPTLKDDPKFGVPWGGGRVAVGAPPDWSEQRLALNATVGQFYVYRSAIMVPVCPTVDTGTTPHARTLLLTRINGYMKPEPLLPGLVGAGRPAINGDPVTGRPQVISAIELSRAALGGTSDDLLREAGACLEWGPLRGVAGVQVDNQGATPSTRFALAGYAVTDAGVDVAPRYTGAASWQSDISATTVPVGDQPDAIPASGAVAPGYTFPTWAVDNGFVGGTADNPGAFTLPDASISRMWAANAGVDVPAEPAMLVIQIAVGVNVAPFDAEASTGSPGSFTYQTFSVPAHQALKFITYAVDISAAGVLTFAVLHEFIDARYDPVFFAQTQRVNYNPYLGLNTLDGQRRMVCSRRVHNYDILPAEADTPETGTTARIQGDLQRKVLNQYDLYTRLADLSFALVAPGGAETPLAMGAFYPVLFTLDTGGPGVSPAPTDGRSGFGTTALKNAEPRYATDIPAPFCEYAPGVLAALLSPTSDYLSTTHLLHIGLFNVTTGAMTHISPALMGYVTNTRFNLSCFEQGTVDEDGALLAHGRLVFTASTLSGSPTRTDGVFVVSGLNKLTWISREPSNVPNAYIGNALAPAAIGATMNLIGVKPTPV